MERPRDAHPYDDLDVIDARAPRFNQTVVAVVCTVAVVTGWWGLASLMGLQLVLGLLLGRRWCLPCVFYFEFIQPRIGEGEIEDARPPRFANLLGAVALSLATALHLGDLHAAGWFLVGMVAALAGLAALTGLCLGCNLYKLSARFRGIRPGVAQRIDLGEIGAPTPGPLVVHFTHPLCTECRSLEKRLRAEGHELVTVDISKRRDLAHKYDVSVVPTALAVSRDGRVISRLT